MTGPFNDADELRDAAVRFGNFVAGWTSEADLASGLTKADAEIIGAHVDYVLLFSGPNVPPIAMEPEDDGATDSAFDHLSAFVSKWPADRIDPATQLSHADLALIAAQRGPVQYRPNRPDFPPDVEDGDIPG